MSISAELLARYADVVVRVGANVQPGQIVCVEADIGAAPLARAIARSAYESGARLVDVWYTDEQLVLGRLQTAAPDTFGAFPGWRPAAMSALMDEGGALIMILSSNPELLREQPEAVVATLQRVEAVQYQSVVDRISQNVTNWTGVAAASPGWAAKVFPALPAAAQEAALWEAIARVCRLDQADPVAAWRAHIAGLAARAAALDERRYTALHYRGPGTDLTVGLAPGHRWRCGAMETRAGLPFVANLPTEEVFTMPDARRVDGVVRATMPLNLGGTLVEEFSLTFRDGRAVAATAGAGQALLDALLRTDEGAARLGEVALVPQSSPIAQAGTLFYNTLFDENAACHLALGNAYRFTQSAAEALDDDAFRAGGGNLSAIHVDFMVGSAALTIEGVRADGGRETVLANGEWAWA